MAKAPIFGMDVRGGRGYGAANSGGIVSVRVSQLQHQFADAGLRAMRSQDLPAAASLLAPVMGWSPPMVQSTFGLGDTVVSEVVSDRDQLVGVVHVVTRMPGVPDGMFLLRMVVAEAARGRGLGSLLWQRMLDALPAGAIVAGRAPADDSRSLAIVARWRFTPAGTTLYQRRELTAQSQRVPPPMAKVSLEVERGRLTGALLDRVAAVMATANVLEVPVATFLDPDATSGEFSVEPTLSLIAAQPGEVVAVFAVADGLDVGYTIAFVEGSGWHIGDTGVAPAWRRRGVATWLKAEVSRLAAGDGAEWMTTHNDTDNVPILALNEATGFYALRRIVALRREPTITFPIQTSRDPGPLGR
jgi:GNAT superfamily N-acetyltransferase